MRYWIAGGLCGPAGMVIQMKLGWPWWSGFPIVIFLAVVVSILVRAFSEI